MATINLIDIYVRAFGRRETFAAVDATGRVEARDHGYGIDLPYEPEADDTSLLGTPIFMPLEIDGYRMPNEPIITVTQTKLIVKTVVQGIKGTVKEEISMGDYNINIKGIIVNEESDEFPGDDVRRIRSLVEKTGALPVKSPFLSLFGIDRIVIEQSTFQGIEGHQSQQAYQLMAVSDRPLELIMREGL
jgi:hypothetical protein